MKIIDKNYVMDNKFTSALYDFDRLSQIHGFFELLDRLDTLGITIERIGASELSDYDEHGKSLYVDYKDKMQLAAEFRNIYVAEYSFNGHKGEININGRVVPSVNRLIIDYLNEYSDEIEKMLDQLDDD